MTKSIKHVISMLRGYIKQVSDDSKYADSFLYDVLLSIRNDILPKELYKGKHIPLNLWKLICIQVCPDDFIPCDCIDVDIQKSVLKSKQKIPNYIATKSYRYLQIRTVDNQIQIPYKTPIQGKMSKYKKSSNKMWFTIINDHLYIVNHPTNNIKVVLLNIVLVDPRDAILISLCDYDGNVSGGNCYDSSRDSFNIPANIENVVMNMAMKQLGFTLQLPDDTSNNTQSSTNQY